MASLNLSFRPGLLVACLVLGSPTVGFTQAGKASVDAQRAEARSGSAPLEPGDAIELSAWREPDLSGRYMVDETGTVVLPLLGSRRVTGTPAAELKRRLLEEYGGQLRSPDIQLLLLRRVKVLGAVKNPGLYHVDPTMNLSDVIALAGGSTREGRLGGLRIQRGDREFRSDLDEAAPIPNGLRSGDRILVPERSWFARHSPILAGATISALTILISRLTM